MELFRRHYIIREYSAFRFGNDRAIRERDLVEPVHPVHDEAMLRSEVHQNLAEQFRQTWFIHAEDLNGRSGRIGQGPQKVEHGADAHLLSRGRAMFHGSVIEGRNENSDSYFID